MNQSAKRTESGSKTCPNGLPALTDYELANKVALLPLSASDHQKAILLTVGLVPGKFGLLARPDRDWLMRIASEAGALPRFPKKKRPKEPIAADRYCDDETEATERVLRSVVASQVPSLGGRMPVPPPRRHS